MLQLCCIFSNSDLLNMKIIAGMTAKKVTKFAMGYDKSIM